MQAVVPVQRRMYVLIQSSPPFVTSGAGWANDSDGRFSQAVVCTEENFGGCTYVDWSEKSQNNCVNLDDIL